ncbi:hypothetical protein SeMB42_g07646 [Synchytrium endobioticum]|uniref:Uncharacterized protein n=1 Tax=Synchytrium endobioticum TaxID=286115 RepID=A0A507BXL1_9FUNG|nr:hypothetical protein SeMB42_g07646 [Synchytrium endobioticum]
MNINIVLYVTAVIFIFRLAQGAPIPDDADIKKMIVDMQRKATREVYDRGRAINLQLASRRVDNMPKKIDEIRVRAIPENWPYTKEQLLKPDEENMPNIQMRFARAYHALVFERLKTMFMRLQLLYQLQLDMVWSALLEHYALALGFQEFSGCDTRKTLKLPPRNTPEQVQSFDRTEVRYIGIITDLRQKCKDKIDALRTCDHTSQFQSATRRRIMDSKESRFRVLEETREWTTALNYGALNHLVLDDRRWLPLWLAHEDLILARAQYDVARMELYVIRCQEYVAEVSNRLYEFAVFIEDHKRKINVYSKSSGGLAMLQGSCVDDTVASSSTEAGEAASPPSSPSSMQRSTDGREPQMLDRPSESNTRIELQDDPLHPYAWGETANIATGSYSEFGYTHQEADDPSNIPVPTIIDSNENPAKLSAPSLPFPRRLGLETYPNRNAFWDKQTFLDNATPESSQPPLHRTSEAAYIYPNQNALVASSSLTLEPYALSTLQTPSDKPFGLHEESHEDTDDIDFELLDYLLGYEEGGHDQSPLVTDSNVNKISAASINKYASESSSAAALQPLPPQLERFANLNPNLNDQTPARESVFGRPLCDNVDLPAMNNIYAEHNSFQRQHYSQLQEFCTSVDNVQSHKRWKALTKHTSGR